MMQRRELPDGWDAGIPSFEADEGKGVATRKASNKVQNAIAERVPWLIAGSADLTDSTSVRLTFDGVENFEPGAYDGRWPHVHFEVYASLDDATAAGSKLLTSQIALPEDTCNEVYATSGYETSVSNMARTSLQRDMVFADSYAQELGTISGTVGEDDLMVTLAVGV